MQLLAPLLPLLLTLPPVVNRLSVALGVGIGRLLFGLEEAAIYSQHQKQAVFWVQVVKPLQEPLPTDTR